MSDLSALSREVMQVLTPFLPYLLAPAQEALQVMGERLGEAAWEKLRALWERLRAQESVVQVAQTAATVPENPALQEALRLEIQRALEAQPDLVPLVRELLRVVGQGVGGQQASRSVHIQGPVSNSIIVTGDQNRVSQRIQK